MSSRCSNVIRWAVISLGVAMVTCHVEILDDEDDFDYDYEDDQDSREEDKVQLKKPLPEAKNPLHENRQFVQDRGHIKEHMPFVGSLLDNADDVSAEFHFFKSHDFNNDGHLDGLELWTAIEHSMESQIDRIKKDKKIQASLKKRRVDRLYWQLEATIDKILREDDFNKDGYLSYIEFANARMTPSIVTQTAIN